MKYILSVLFLGRQQFFNPLISYNSRGENLLFADADGATTFSDLSKLEKCLEEITKEDEGVVCGSRSHLEKESIANRTAIRTLLMYGFHACVWIFAVKTVQDTQCGFKVRSSDQLIVIDFEKYFQLIKRNTARKIFKTLHIERWAFDVEMLKVHNKFESLILLLIYNSQ